MESNQWLWQILLQILLIALNAIFACAEIAVISVNGNHLKKMVAEGNRKAVRLQKLTEIPASFLATIQIAITLSGFLGSAFAADNFADRLLALFAGIGVAVPRSVIVILITILLSYVTLVFGELVPKRLAMKKTEQIALGLSGILTLVAKIFAPLVWLLTASTNGVLRLLRVNPEEEEEIVTEEEIRMMVDAGEEKGSIDSTEQELIHNIFAFDDISVNEICTHRTAVSVLWEKDSLEQWKETVHQSGHSFFPVCGEDIDDIRGVLSAKDIFRLSGDYGKEGLLSEVLRPAVFVPATVKADVLFANMKKSGNYFAVVLDEYGGMDGIITLRDLIEELVGDLDENGSHSRQIVQLDNGSWRIQGLTELDDVARALGVSLPVEEYDTFGGYVFGQLGRIPADGTSFFMETEDLDIKVENVKDHRVESTIVSKKKNNAPAGEGDS